MIIAENLQKINNTLSKSVTLVAVSKTKPISALKEAYNAGQRIFGENKIQDMVEKHEALPKDIQWHMIGHLQRNKIKYMAHFVNLIHGVDSLKALKEIDKQAKKNDRIIECLLQIKIATEDTKFGLEPIEVNSILNSQEYKEFENVKIIGFMGMTTFTDNKTQIRNEFKSLKKVFDFHKKENSEIKVLSMGMSGDYKIAVEEGSTMVRVGSSIFGHRNYT